MLITVQIEVDVDDLEIDYDLTHDELTTEYWGSVKTDRWTDVEINSVILEGTEVELDDENLQKLEKYLQENG